jgi:hypothetical protein
MSPEKSSPGRRDSALTAETRAKFAAAWAKVLDLATRQSAGEQVGDELAQTIREVDQLRRVLPFYAAADLFAPPAESEGDAT